MVRRRADLSPDDADTERERAEPTGREAGFLELATLDMPGLRRRWRSLVGGTMPAGIGRDLTLRILAYQRQVQRYGDLDRASRKILAGLVPNSVGAVPADATSRPTQRVDAQRSSGSSAFRPGTLLAREHAGELHRVMVMEDGFGWNGRTYDSLSKVAFAITGTRWNGPRFFGLRDRPKLPELTSSSRAGKIPSRSTPGVEIQVSTA